MRPSPASGLDAADGQAMTGKWSDRKQLRRRVGTGRQAGSRRQVVHQAHGDENRQKPAPRRVQLERSVPGGKQGRFETR